MALFDFSFLEVVAACGLSAIPAIACATPSLALSNSMLPPEPCHVYAPNSSGHGEFRPAQSLTRHAPYLFYGTALL
jgi:hypothetical protein